MMRMIPLPIDVAELGEICRRHAIKELSLFGSVLRDDFRAGSDVDVLVEFEEGTTLTLDSYVDIQEDLSAAFEGRRVDLIELKRLVDPYRRHEILRTREIVYVH